jgi:2-dehydro-3-deoxygluconokinase
MLRLSPPGLNRLEANSSLEIHIGGAESNVAVALARLGKRVAWWSRLPESPLGKLVAHKLNSYGVDTTGVRWIPQARLGTYFVEFGTTPRPTQVIYDRANSAASGMTPDDFNWSKVAESRWLHLTGITPALSDSCRTTIQHALEQAQQHGTPASLDINYRARLWPPDQAAAILDPLARLASVVIVAERDANTLFKVSGEPGDLTARLRDRWNGAVIVLTQSHAGASGYDGTLHQVPAIPVPYPIQIGAGDAFAAGLIYALLDARPLAEALRYGCAVAALKLTMPGDLALISLGEVEQLLSAGGGGVAR